MLIQVMRKMRSCLVLNVPLLTASSCPNHYGLCSVIGDFGEVDNIDGDGTQVGVLDRWIDGWVGGWMDINCNIYSQIRSSTYTTRRRT
jgi:hypothetical protein